MNFIDNVVAAMEPKGRYKLKKYFEIIQSGLRASCRFSLFLGGGELGTLGGGSTLLKIIIYI